MRFQTSVSAAALVLTLSLGTCVYAQTNEQERKADHAQAKVDEKANKEAAKLTDGKAKKAYKAQAKADHDTHKALNDDGTKKAARKQDKANKKAAEAGVSTY